MQISSRDFWRPKTSKNSLSENGTSLNQESFTLNAPRWLKKVAVKDLWPDFLKFFINFENKRHFVLVPSPPIRVNS